MLSILIPVYNYDVRNLVKELGNQCISNNAKYEIVCYDDASLEKYRQVNRALDQEFNVSYIELQENKGRSKIRNMLAQNARYETLLFIDCDSKVAQDNFISNYLQAIENNQVIYGGRIYQAERPAKEYILHWKYGSKRESLSDVIRSKKPYRSFMTNNFTITRSLMMKIRFNESITTYGYEDLLIAEAIKNEGIAIEHIDNPLIHNGLETTESFIHKAQQAAENLANLYHSGLLSNTKMIDFHQKLENIGFNSFLHKIIRRRKDQILKNLNSQNPNLFYFDLFRYEHFHAHLNHLKASSS